MSNAEAASGQWVNARHSSEERRRPARAARSRPGAHRGLRAAAVAGVVAVTAAILMPAVAAGTATVAAGTAAVAAGPANPNGGNGGDETGCCG